MLRLLSSAFTRENYHSFHQNCPVLPVKCDGEKKSGYYCYGRAPGQATPFANFSEWLVRS